MNLVDYSDSEGSDGESDPIPQSRKIRVALPEIKPENPADEEAGDGPARKRLRLGGSGALSGFNSFLPAPKRQAEKNAPVASTRKVFSLKTGATPGFSRESDAELRQEQALNDYSNATEDQDEEDITIPKAGHRGSKLQGNPMMFRPLSVGRQKKKKPNAAKPVSSASAATNAVDSQASSGQKASADVPPSIPAPAPPKPKVSLFSFSSEDSDARSATATATSSSTYEPMMYTTEAETEAETDAASTDLNASYANMPAKNAYPTTHSVTSSLDNIANDLNLSKSERRQLFGRNAPSANSQIRTFNTDQEYASNQALAQSELAGIQHNPVRAVAHGGKTSLKQLVTAASSQKEALEESFAAGRRNKKEAGSRYGW
ncbi:hypothetical protein N7468_008357 [Penicillium chermesinum]|uniref:Mitotic checkpoint regulator, MAD2B-interacting-domain-containing protein n=1 Tax=Penicillium chermesinum TaxID=63820 RepID=A0A9W9NPR1_9EURO|nr:uncharacterized protein N7468_008357 [Penicillium chermesinum]KAJ5223815.1 hypothetical protein N7468_008357 [Penicillium chermesinum]